MTRLVLFLLAPLFCRWIAMESDKRRRVEERVRLMDGLAQRILQSHDLTTTLDFTLRQICEISGWAYGEAWVPSADGTCLEFYSGSCRKPGTCETFMEASRQFRFPKGVGLPGRAWSTGKPVWIPDAVSDSDFGRRALARKAGLGGALAFPILTERKLTLVLAFFISAVRPEVDEQMVEIISGAAAQLGSLIERQRAEEKRRTLAKANEMKNRLLSIAAHDLRNPLTVMVGHLALLQEEIVDGVRKEQVAIVQRKCKQMLALIDGLLDLSIIESRAGVEVPLDLQSLDLGEFLGELCADGRILANNKSITIKLQLEPGLPAVMGDRARLQQAIANLISNAIKYSPLGKTIVVSAHAAEDAVAISVADEGNGIPGKDLPRLFKEYGRAEVHPTGGERSVGLGLYIAQSIVQSHNGTIRVESTPGAGATFTASLPLRHNKKDTQVLNLI